MTAYIVSSTVVFWVLFAIWKPSEVINLFIKVIFLLFALVGSVLSLSVLGFILHR